MVNNLKKLTTNEIKNYLKAASADFLENSVKKVKNQPFEYKLILKKSYSTIFLEISINKLEKQFARKIYKIHC